MWKQQAYLTVNRTYRCTLRMWCRDNNWWRSATLCSQQSIPGTSLSLSPQYLKQTKQTVGEVTQVQIETAFILRLMSSFDKACHLDHEIKECWVIHIWANNNSHTLQKKKLSHIFKHIPVSFNLNTNYLLNCQLQILLIIDCWNDIIITELNNWRQVKR